ncbi:MAG TPA: lytic transglycosylase domain-containing protein, partial [Terriglobales bacterium]
FAITHEMRGQMGEYTRLYLTDDASSYVDVPTVEILRFEKDPTPPKPIAPPKTSVNLSDAIAASSYRHRIDPDLITSVIHAESGFNSHAISPKGAQGLMQLMPQTAAKLGVNNSFDPSSNVDGGTKYLRELLERYNFDLVKALAAYNAGPHRVEQYGGVPPYRETQAYVARIVREFNRKKLAQQKMAVKKAPSKKSTQAKQTPAANQTAGTH